MKKLLGFILIPVTLLACGNDCNCGCGELTPNMLPHLNINLDGFEAVQLARDTFQSGDQTRGIELMHDVISTFYPQKRELWLDLSKMHEAVGDRTSAVQCAQKAIEISEKNGTLDQVYANSLYFMAFLHLKIDMAKAVDYSKKWQQYDRYAIKTIDNADGTISHFIPHNMLT